MIVNLYVYDEHQCDPKKCTGRKLMKFNLAQEIASLRRIPHGAVVLTPYAEKAISREDTKTALASAWWLWTCPGTRSMTFQN